MTDLIFYFLAAFVSSIATGALLWQRRSWSDDDYYDLVEKYAESASALTAMKAELDKLQEQLEFSEDVRYTLGMKNAKLANEIEGLKSGAERGEEVRDMLVRSINDSLDLHLYSARLVARLQRSLRIARHKEFKRWKKWKSKRPSRRPYTILPADLHACIREYKTHWRRYPNPKMLIRIAIDSIRTMDPYPLP